MEIHIHVEKKHIYALIAVLVLAFSTFFVFALHGDGSALPNPVNGVFHYLQNVVKDDALNTVDSNNNGVIDSSDSCGIDATDSICDVNTIKLTPRAAAPPSPDNTIWYQN